MQVKVLRSFQSARWGSRAVGDKPFDYPVSEDPDRLVADGFVERVATTSTAKPAARRKQVVPAKAKPTAALAPPPAPAPPATPSLPEAAAEDA